MAFETAGSVISSLDVSPSDAGARFDDEVRSAELTKGLKVFKDKRQTNRALAQVVEGGTSTCTTESSTAPTSAN